MGLAKVSQQANPSTEPSVQSDNNPVPVQEGPEPRTEQKKDKEIDWRTGELDVGDPPVKVIR